MGFWLRFSQQNQSVVNHIWHRLHGTGLDRSDNRLATHHAGQHVRRMEWPRPQLPWIYLQLLHVNVC